MDKDKKLIQGIFTNTLEIISLLTGQVSVLQDLTNSLTVFEMNKDKKKTESILKHALEVVYLVTGEEYTIVKKNDPNSSIHQLTSESSTDGHNERMDGKDQSLKTLGIPASSSSDVTEIEDESLTPDSEEKEDEIDEKDILQVTIHSELIEGLPEENIYTVSINEDGEYERDRKGVQQVIIQSDPHSETPDLKPLIVPKLEPEEELNISCMQQIKEEVIPIRIVEVNTGHEGTRAYRKKKSKRTTKAVEHNKNVSTTNSHSSQGGIWDDSKQLANQRLNRVKPFRCSECGKCFSHKSTLLTHEKIHAGVKSFSCSECGKCFNKKSNLVYHESMHKGVKPFACSQCGKCFSQMSDCITHERIHTGVKPFVCSECGKCFVQKSHLVNHERIHTGVKPFACSQCDKCFIQKSHLAYHERSHTGVKPFACTQCGKCFSQMSACIAHEKIHTGVKPFECSQCGKCFTKKSNLGKHERIHTGLKPFACSECGKCFIQKSHLAYHERTHAGGKPSESP